MSKFNEVIFSNYEFNNKLFEAYKNNIFNGLIYIGNYFNKPVDNLPSSITHLTFGKSFNLPVDNLPSSITHLTFGESFNLPVDNLPNRLSHLIFNNNYYYKNNKELLNKYKNIEILFK